jgi:hypothetical protein
MLLLIHWKSEGQEYKKKGLLGIKRKTATQEVERMTFESVITTAPMAAERSGSKEKTCRKASSVSCSPVNPGNAIFYKEKTPGNLARELDRVRANDRKTLETSDTGDS